MGASQIVWKQLGTTGKNNFFIAAQVRGIINLKVVFKKLFPIFRRSEKYECFILKSSVETRAEPRRAQRIGYFHCLCDFSRVTTMNVKDYIFTH